MDMKPKTLLRRMLDFARAELERRARPLADDVVGSAQAAPLSDAGREPSEVPEPRGEGHARGLLDVSRSHDGTLRAEWALSRERIERSERIAGEHAVLCLRVVSFEGARDDVKREVLDRPCVEPSGACDLGSGDVRGVVAIGLRAGERFVSIAHHIV